MYNYNFIIFYLSITSAVLMYLGIKLANSRFKNIFGTCLSNEKTSLYHEPIIRGLGILYIFALSPIFVFIEESISLNAIVLVVFSTLLGFYDDKYGISQIKKILLLVSIILLIEIFLVKLEYFLLIGLLSKIILFLFFTLFFNQIDGINGLAGSTFIFTCFGFLLLFNDLINIQFVISIIVVTIIYLNTNFKGNIGIQGEAGSFFMGSVIYIFFEKINNPQDLIYIIMFLFPVLTDVISTTLVRVWYIKNIFLSHRNHLYQRLVAKNKSHLRTTAYFAIIQLSAIIITFFFYNLDYSIYKILGIITFILFFMVINLRYSFLIHKERY